MKISKTHQKFADKPQAIREYALTHPENFLGPNWEAVINFWLYLDNLTEEQLMDVEHHYDSLIYEEFDIAYNNALNAARATTYTDGAGRSAYQSVSYANSAAAFATYELIGLKKLLERGHQPVFFPMFLNP